MSSTAFLISIPLYSLKRTHGGAKSYDESAKKGNRQDIASVPTLLSKTILSAEDAHFDPIGK